MSGRNFSNITVWILKEHEYDLDFLQSQIRVQFMYMLTIHLVPCTQKFDALGSSCLTSFKCFPQMLSR